MGELFESALMSLSHLLHLAFIALFDQFDECVLVRLEFVLVNARTFLELNQGHFELLLKVEEVPLVLVFLTSEELAFAVPQSFLAVVF